MKKDEEQYDRFVELLRTPLPTLDNPDGLADSIWQAIGYPVCIAGGGSGYSVCRVWRLHFCLLPG